MVLCDTHIHLYADEFKNSLDDLMLVALQKNIKKFFIPNIDSSSMESMFAICKKFSENCFPILGLHPCYVKENFLTELAIIKSKAEQEKIYGVGEIGIDLYWDKTFLKQQEEAFIVQMQWAHDWQLPIIIHSREATEEIIKIIESNRHLKPHGIFHCFSGSIDQANKIIELGFFLGIGGVLTFKNSGLDKVIANVNMSHIVLETDAPYLAPAPHRGKINEPAYLFLVAEKLAALKNIPIEEVAEITSNNAAKVFNIS